MGSIKNKVIYDEEEIERIVGELQAVLGELEKHEKWLEEMECAAGIEELVSNFVHKSYFEEKHKREVAERALDLAVNQLRLYELAADNEAEYYLKRAAAEQLSGGLV